MLIGRKGVGKSAFSAKIQFMATHEGIWGRAKAQSRFTDEQFQAFLNEMNHIGVNINQIARRVNEARQASSEQFDLLELHYEQRLDLFRKCVQY